MKGTGWVPGTGQSGATKTRTSVLYHCTSGQICQAPGQDPSHSDDDVTQYMQQGLLRPMVYSSKEVLPSVCPFASVWICFGPDCFCLSCFPFDSNSILNKSPAC